MILLLFRIQLSDGPIRTNCFRTGFTNYFGTYFIIVVRLAIDEYSRTIAQKPKWPSFDYCSVAYNPPNECLQIILCDAHMQTKYIYKAWERTPQFFRELPRNKAWERTPQNFSGIRPAYAWERAPLHHLLLGNVPHIRLGAYQNKPHTCLGTYPS